MEDSKVKLYLVLKLDFFILRMFRLIHGMTHRNLLFLQSCARRLGCLRFLSRGGLLSFRGENIGRCK